MANFALLNVYLFVLWITVLDLCTKLLLALSFVCRLDFTSGHESPLMGFLLWKQIEPCSKETVLEMRSVHVRSKWFTELQTRATLFRHVEDSRIAHHPRNTWQTYCVRRVHLMAFCPSVVFQSCRHDICFFLELVFFFVFLFEDFCTQKGVRNETWSLLPKWARPTSTHLISLKAILILFCYFHLCIPILLFPSCFPQKKLQAYLYPMHSTCSARRMFFDLIIFSFGEG